MNNPQSAAIRVRVLWNHRANRAAHAGLLQLELRAAVALANETGYCIPPAQTSKGACCFHALHHRFWWHQTLKEIAA